MLRGVVARLHPGYEARGGVGRVAGVEAVDVAEYDERVAVEHSRDETGKLVVVGEHQFGYAHGVVLVDNRYDAVSQHHHHAVALVEIMSARGETLLHGQHLADVDAPVAEKVVVAVDELDLPHGRKELARIDIVELRKLHAAQFRAPARHSTGGYKHDLDAV